PHKFGAFDGSRHRFEGIVFPWPGVYRLWVAPIVPLGPSVYRLQGAQLNGSLRQASNPIEVFAAPPSEHVYWGDTHTHTSYSDGRGTVAEAYEFGRDYSALDFCSVTDHSFLVSDKMWQEIKDVTNRFYRPSEYVTFLAYEWSGMTELGGDHNVYFRDA